MMIDVLEVLEALGIDYSERGAEANALCPQHEARTGKADNSPSWYINIDTGQHICFSCGYKGNLIQLVCDVNEFYFKNWADTYDYDYATAETWLGNVSQIPMERLEEILAGLPAYVGAAPKPLEMNEARLAVFVSPPKAALDSRNLTEEAASQYGLLWDAKTSTWILPLREPHFSRLMGWQEKGTIHRTFFNRPGGLQKSKTLFGIENQNESMVVVVESPLDCVRIASAGIPGAVAICGASISDEQVKLLRYSQKVVAALDNDKAGEKGSKLLLEWGRKYGLNLFYFNYGSIGKKDPGDMTDDEIHWGIENAQSSILGEAAYVQRDS